MTLWINGDWVTGQGALRVKRNPVSGEVLWQGNDADAAQVGQACRAARAAFPRWARLSFGDRQVRVERFAGLLESNKAELTAIIARETGKPRWEAATEVTAMINKIAISIKAYHVRTGEQRSEMPDGAAQHPNYKYLSDFDKKNAFDVERYMSTRPAIVKPDEPFDIYEIDLSDEDAAAE